MLVVSGSMRRAGQRPGAIQPGNGSFAALRMTDWIGVILSAAKDPSPVEREWLLRSAQHGTIKDEKPLALFL